MCRSTHWSTETPLESMDTSTGRAGRCLPSSASTAPLSIDRMTARLSSYVLSEVTESCLHYRRFRDRGPTRRHSRSNQGSAETQGAWSLESTSRHPQWAVAGRIMDVGLHHRCV